MFKLVQNVLKTPEFPQNTMYEKIFRFSTSCDDIPFSPSKHPSKIGTLHHSNGVSLAGQKWPENVFWL